jgi:hypothetical protein
MMSHSQAHVLNIKAGIRCKMTEYTKISFNHRKDLADYGDLVEILVKGGAKLRRG